MFWVMEEEWLEFLFPWKDNLENLYQPLRSDYAVHIENCGVRILVFVSSILTTWMSGWITKITRSKCIVTTFKIYQKCIFAPRTTTRNFLNHSRTHYLNIKHMLMTNPSPSAVAIAKAVSGRSNLFLCIIIFFFVSVILRCLGASKNPQCGRSLLGLVSKFSPGRQ